MMNPIERPWGLTHGNGTPKQCYAICGRFADATRDFLRGKIPLNGNRFGDFVSENFASSAQGIFGF